MHSGLTILHMLINNIKKLIFALIIVALSIFETAQGQSSYFTFGDAKMDRGKLIYPQTPKSVIIAGETEDSDSPNKLLFLSSVTAEGNVNWYKTYGGNISYAVNDGAVTSDGGFVFSAEQYYLNDRETLYLMKMDNMGNIQWTNLFDEGGNEVEGLSIAQTRDGGYIVTGLIKIRATVSDIFFTMKQEKQYLYLLKTDKNGKKEWSKKFNYDSGTIATGHKVLETEHGYIIGGVILVINDGKDEEKTSEMLLLEVDFKGGFLWAKKIGGSKNEFIENMSFIDNDLFIIGATTSFGEGKTDAFLTRLNGKGEMKWFKTYGGLEYESMSSITEVNKNNLLIVGGTRSFGNGSYDALILTVDKKGETITSETFGQEKHDEMGSAVVKDNKVYLTGFSFTSTTKKSTQAYLLSYELGKPNKECFFKPAEIKAIDHGSEIKITELNKQMLSDIPPVGEKITAPVNKTEIKNKTLTTEVFCK